MQSDQHSETRAAMGDAEVACVMDHAALYRERLSDLSWLMRVLNEITARKANRKEGDKVMRGIHTAQSVFEKRVASLLRMRNSHRAHAY